MDDRVQIIFYCYFVVAVAMSIIVITFVIPTRKHPLLDWAFIWAQTSLSLLAVFFLMLHYGFIKHHTDSIINVSLILWVNSACAKLFVLYCIYRERFGERFAIYLRRKRGSLWNFVSRSYHKRTSIVRGRR